VTTTDETPTLQAILRGCAESLLEHEHEVRPSDVVECALTRYPGVMAEQRDRLIYQAAQRIVKDLLRQEAETDDDQLQLDGLAFPRAIAVRSLADVYYVRCDKAVWREVQAGYDEREHNVVAAIASRDAYEASMERLRPIMADQPDMTVAEALAVERKGLPA
jgi:hypothetical protein